VPFLSGFDHKTFWGLPVGRRLLYVDLLSRLHHGADDYVHHGVKLVAGQCLVTRQTLANSTGLTAKTVSAHLAKMPMFLAETVKADVSGHRALRVTYLLSDAHFRGRSAGNTEGNTGRYTGRDAKQNTKKQPQTTEHQAVNTKGKAPIENTKNTGTGNTGRYTGRDTQYLQGLCYKLKDTIFKDKNNVEFGNLFNALKRCHKRTQAPAIRTRFGDADKCINYGAFGDAMEWWLGTVNWDTVDNPVGYLVAVWDQKTTGDDQWDHPIGQYNRQKHDTIQQAQDLARETGLDAEQEKRELF
jgi:hypothetical protein